MELIPESEKLFPLELGKGLSFKGFEDLVRSASSRSSNWYILERVPIDYRLPNLLIFRMNCLQGNISSTLCKNI